MMKRRTLGLASFVFVLAPTIALSSEPTSLKEIMRELRENLIEISDGLLVDDFEKIARGAIGIAEHPQIPAAQKQLVATELGEEMASFKQLDTRVHDLSLEIHAAAKALDRDAATSGFQQLIEGCFDCHYKYEERIAEILKDSD
jgi:cytochrome c556